MTTTSPRTPPSQAPLRLRCLASITLLPFLAAVPVIPAAGAPTGPTPQNRRAKDDKPKDDKSKDDKPKDDKPKDWRHWKRELRERFPDRRQRAVAKLSKLDHAEAWELVVGALADRDARVADEAQLALGRLEDPKLLRLITGRGGLGDRDPWVRLRVAEALGRVPLELEPKLLARAIEPRHEPLACALAWTVERQALAGRLTDKKGSLARALARCEGRQMGSRLRAAAWTARVTLAVAGERGDESQAARRGTPTVDGPPGPATPRADSKLAQLPPEVAAAIQAAFGDGEASLRRAALDFALRYDPECALRRARQLVSDESLSVRTTAALVCGYLPRRDGLLSLAERLPVEPRRRMQERLVNTLQRATGMKYRADVRPWRRYLQQQPADWRPSPARDGTTLGSGRSAVASAGLPILSDRLAFLIDFSGSLWQTQVGDKSRKEIVDQALRAALESLPTSARFNLIPYTGEPHPWRDSLVDASPKEIRSAMNFFERCNERGTGNVYDAIGVALQDPEVDTLVILTDGAPTGGRRWNLGLMVELLLEETRYRSVAFDSVLVDAPKGLRKHWQALAERSDGTSIAVRWDPKQGVRPER